MIFSVVQPTPGGGPAWNPLQGTYGVHQFVWNLMGNPAATSRGFLYRLDATPRPRLYIVSDAKPQQIPADWTVRCTDYTPETTANEVLVFKLRANATVARKTKGEQRGKRHSVVADAVRSDDRPYRAVVDDAYRRWLDGQGERNGFQVLDATVDAHRRVIARRQKGGKDIRFDQGDVHGSLRVMDPAAFNDVLVNGLGRSRAFGCGLLMVRRP